MPTYSNTLIDNNSIKMVDVLNEYLSNDSCNELLIASGFWDLPGTNLLKDSLSSFLKRGGKLKLLIGKEPLLKNSQFKSFNDQKKELLQNLIQDGIKEEFHDTVQLLIDYISDDFDNSQIQVKVYKTDSNNDGVNDFMHAKCYIIYNSNNLADHACGIIGSSNFTAKGLKDNAELNYLETDPHVIFFPKNDFCIGHKAWFFNLWNDAQQWDEQFIIEALKEITTKSPKPFVAKPTKLSPHEVYIKYLQRHFGEIVNPSIDSILASYLPEEYQALQYQTDAVKQCYNNMKHYGGFMLADVVGLGKTVVGTMLIKYFINNAEDRAAKVLIITPPAIKNGWEETIKHFDNNRKDKIFNKIDFITTGSIGKLVDFEMEETAIDADNDLDVATNNISNSFEKEFSANDYGLIIIDESHNFRNSETQKYKALKSLINNIFTQNHYYPYVGLISATPQNNSPKDLKNQIYLFQIETNKTNIPGITDGKLDTFFTICEERFKNARTIKDLDEQKKLIKEISAEIREKVLNYILVRRTRTDIQLHYDDNLKFPKVVGPNCLDYEMDEKLAQLFFDTIQAINPSFEIIADDKTIQYARYCAIQYFSDPKNTKLYEKKNLTVDAISLRLQKIMKILLVKRLESSKDAFIESLSNLLEYTRNMITMLENDCVFICPDININDEFKKANGIFADAKKSIIQKIDKKKGNNRQFKSVDFKKDYLIALRNDETIINNLYNRWVKIKEDPKLAKFRKVLRKELFNPNINTSGKLVIFTEAISTLDQITTVLKEEDYRVLGICAKNRDELQQTIRENFDANYKGEQKDDYDVIVTTEVLAEGVNLHRANVILNYDTPWNSTKLMQRIGRVNRIGSAHDNVYVYNFYPSIQGDNEIKLVQTAFAKIQSFIELFGEDSKIFSTAEELSEIDSYSQLIDGEESPLSKYISELKQYEKENPARYQEIYNAPFENLGGVRENIEKQPVILTSDTTIGEYLVYGGEVQQSSLIEILPYLKAEPTEVFSSYELKDDIKQLVSTKFESQLVKHTDHKDIDKKAMSYLKDLQKKYELSDNCKKLLKKADKAIRNNNLHVIECVKNLQNEFELTPSLLDYNAIIESTLTPLFENLKKEVEKKRGKTVFAICETNK